MTFVQCPLFHVALLLSLLPASTTSASDWLHPRGPSLDGRAALNGLGSTAEEAAWRLEPAWTTAIGSGYSGIVVHDGQAVTSFSDGDADWTASFNVATGHEVWRQRIGPRYPAHDGSDDGPSSSPVIGHGLVFTLHPLGNLMALRLSDGTVVWQRHIAEDWGGLPSDFGFTVTPAVDGDIVVLPVGSRQNALVGLDARTGEVRWRGGDGQVLHQSPTVATLAGRRQVVAVTATALFGFAPEDGTPLWRHPLPADDRAHPTTVVTPFAEDRFLVRMMDNYAAFQVSRSDDGFQLAELYRSAAFGRSHAPPVYHQGHLYGFRGSILHCARADTGERVWRSRTPGGESVVVVGETLLIFAERGAVVLADASPDGYRERDRLQVLDASSLTWPSLSGNRLLIRNLEQMAAVTIRTVPAPSGPSITANLRDTTDHAFGRWLRKAATSDQPQAAVEQWWQDHPVVPIREGSYLHFAVRADAEDVAIQGSMLEDEALAPLTRLVGTDFFYRSFELAPGGRWEYRFQLDYETWIMDPQNPRTVPDWAGTGTRSETRPPDYRPAPHLDPPTGPRGRIEVVNMPGLEPDTLRDVAVWLPPGYDGGRTRYPLLLVQDGEAWLNHGKLSISLDNLVRRSVAPAVVAFVRPSPVWWSESGGTGTETYAPWVAETLVPALGEHFRLLRKDGAHAILGHRYYGFSALYVALQYPEIFGSAAAISPGLGLGHDDALAALIAAGAGRSIRIHLDWNRHGLRRIDRAYDFTRFGRTLARQLDAAGHTVTGGERLDSVGWGGWRNRNDLVLQAILPLDQPSPSQP